jgi:hypothetical protein
MEIFDFFKSKPVSEIDISVSIEGSYLNTDSLCENCKKVINKEMLLNETVKQKLLPIKDCT